MKIQLVSDAPPAQASPRVPYDTCPLCGGQDAKAARDVDASEHGGSDPELEPRWGWLGCATCGHLFTEGYLAPSSLQAAHARPWLPRTLEPTFDVQRQEAASIVQRVSRLRGSLEGLWLDVGCGASALLTTAHEFGYETLGIDLRQAAVERLKEEGYQAECSSIESIAGEDLCDIISFCDSLEAHPQPRAALEAAGRLLRPGGVLFLSAANVDSLAWRQLDRDEKNPYWNDPERFHNFSREHLYWLLRHAGFEPCDYMVSARLPAGMDVCAALQSEG